MKRNASATNPGHKIPADARPDLFFDADWRKSRTRLCVGETVGVDALGAHPKLTVRFCRDGQQPSDGDVFYGQ